MQTDTDECRKGQTSRLLEFGDVVKGLERFDRPLTEDEVRNLLMELGSYAFDLSAIERFNDEVYQRNRIVRTDHLDLLLLCWRPGQRTPIHDHSGSICGVSVIRGEGTEIAFTRSGVDLLVPAHSTSISAGDLTVAHDSDIHLVGNFSETHEDLVTLHCYSPPLDRMKVYDQSQTFLAEYGALTEKARASGCYQVTV